MNKLLSNMELDDIKEAHNKMQHTELPKEAFETIPSIYKYYTKMRYKANLLKYECVQWLHLVDELVDELVEELEEK